MELKQFSGEIRTGTGKEAARRVRNSGRVPSVLYGGPLAEPIVLSLDPKDMLPMVSRQNKGRLFELVLGEETHKVFVKDFQVHPIRKSLIHVDLQATQADQPLRAKVPVLLQGPALGEKLGGRVFRAAYDILVEALPEHFPVALSIDIRPMDSGAVVYVDQVVYPEGVKPIYKARYPVVLVKLPRGQDAEEGDVVGGDDEGTDAEGAGGADAEAKPDADE
ncbi:MAG: 50S ribosomal protein L25 [Pseudomonadota bacterium]